MSGSKEKIFKGALSPVDTLKEKDWIINKVSDSIQDNHLLAFDDFADLLHCGTPKYHDVSIIFTPQTCEVDILLTFAGRYSPFKVSDYKLDLSKIDLNKQDFPNYLFTSINENIISSENRKKLGVNKKDTLKKLLLR
ncbi:MAG: hypothetical protein KAX05_16355 [Bacteroidales bacterium]|nr:hypothetical protein [Bacteroidales bacterium]